MYKGQGVNKYYIGGTMKGKIRVIHILVLYSVHTAHKHTHSHHNTHSSIIENTKKG